MGRVRNFLQAPHHFWGSNPIKTTKQAMLTTWDEPASETHLNPNAYTLKRHGNAISA